MVSEYVREQQRYTQSELFGVLGYTKDNDVVPLIRKLKEFGILKAVKSNEKQREMSDLLDEDIEVIDVEPDENDYLYVFTFVGVVVIAGRVLKCYPKYLRNQTHPINEMRQVLKVLEKYNVKEQIVRMFNDTVGNRAFNLLAVLLFLMQDYYENGVYSDTEEIVESNGSGEILWDKTINETFTWLSENRPYYIDLQTRKRVNDDYDYFKRLHECILTKASAELKNAELLDLFEITEVDLTDEQLDEFGEKEVILYQIERELGTQFNTRKQLVLKTIYAYVEHSGSLFDTDCLSLFGTNSFNLVWEKVCADIMDNQLDVRLGDLHLPKELQPGYNRNDKLIDLIEKPAWTSTGKTAGDTLIPDLISIAGDQFVIFDAKYYTPKLEKGQDPQGQPGIESVTKQYLYQLAYKQFIEEHEFKTVKNCFLLPTEDKDVVEKGAASLTMLSKLGLESIEVRLLPAEEAFEHYLSGSKMNIEKLKL